MYGVPKMLRSDNGPEFMAKAIQQWLNIYRFQERCIEPGSPWQNRVCESFNGKLRDSICNRAKAGFSGETQDSNPDSGKTTTSRIPGPTVQLGY
ncbi:MAG: transposase family protein [Pirellulaceae bacterium]|nr:transposase family protein [Pirellulaceae bacterium]